MKDDRKFTRIQISQFGSIDQIGSVINIVSLTMISGFIGVNVGKMPDNFNTGFEIFGAIGFVSFFYLIFEAFVNLIYYRQWARASVLGAISLFLAIVSGWYVGSMVGNFSVGFGLFLGWWLTFLIFVGRGQKIANHEPTSDD
jgi:hypothetical protein